MLPELDRVSRHASALVGGLDVTLQFRRAIPGKAVGPSLVPPELIKAAPREVAALLEPLAFKWAHMCVCVCPCSDRVRILH